MIQAYNPLNYNSLPSSEEADSQVQESGAFTECIRELAGVSEKHGVADFTSVRLGHHHYSPKGSEVMLERYETRNEKLAMVTKAVKREEIDFEIAPHSWLLGPYGYEPFEYSADEETIRDSKLLANKPDFFRDFLEVTTKYGLQRLLVPAIKSRSWLSELLLTMKVVELLETNYDDKEESVVELMNGGETNEGNNTGVSTSWSMGGKEVHTYCCDNLEHNSKEETASVSTSWSLGGKEVHTYCCDNLENVSKESTSVVSTSWSLGGKEVRIYCCDNLEHLEHNPKEETGGVSTSWSLGGKLVRTYCCDNLESLSKENPATVSTSWSLGGKEVRTYCCDNLENSSKECTSVVSTSWSLGGKEVRTYCCDNLEHNPKEETAGVSTSWSLGGKEVRTYCCDNLESLSKENPATVSTSWSLGGKEVRTYCCDNLESIDRK